MRDGDQVFVNYMMVAAGAILYAKSIQVTAQFEETEEDILSQCALQMRTLFQSNATTIIAPIPFITVEEVKVLVPKSGDKKALLDLSIKNTIAFLNEIKKKEVLSPDSKIVTTINVVATKSFKLILKGKK